MRTRLELQKKLEELLGSRNVYYDPPENLKMSYPCIRYSKSKIRSRFANDAAYSLSASYELIVIDKLPDNKVISELLKLQYCTHSRHYVVDNLHHDVFEIYILGGQNNA